MDGGNRNPRLLAQHRVRDRLLKLGIFATARHVASLRNLAALYKLNADASSRPQNNLRERLCAAISHHLAGGRREAAGDIVGGGPCQVVAATAALGKI
jgi:hypothetical protein